MNALRLLITAVISATLIACEETPNTTTQDSINESGFFAKFSPSDGIIPFPNNLLFQGSADGTLEIPLPALDTTICPNAGEIAVKTALNDLDGFSTTAPITTSFSSAINSASLVAANNVRVFTVTLNGSGAVTAITGELTTAEFAVSVSSVDNEIADAACDTVDLGANKLVISPLKPLAAKSSYLVAVTKGITDLQGNNATADAVYAFAKSADPLITGATVADIQFSGLLSGADTDGNGSLDAAEEAAVVASVTSLEGLRQLTNAAETAIETYTVTADIADSNYDSTDLVASDIVMSWTFTTQSVGDVLTALHTKIQTDPVPVSAIYSTSASSSPQTGMPGMVGSEIYVGEITLPYYLNVPANANDSAVLTGSWRGATDTPLTKLNTAVDPATSTAVTVPLLISIPNGTEPGAGWPVVIYQHGITTSRGTMLGIADALANVGYAAVAIDLPLHGLLGDEDQIGALKAATAGFSASIHGGTATVKERTFDLDIFDATLSTTDADGDGALDSSGAHFINLQSILTSRDNVRQAVADLFSLKRALIGMDYNGATAGGVFDVNNVHFVGHSLGGIVGGVFLAIETSVKSSVLAMPGGGIAKLLDGSATFGSVISAGLGVNGVNKGFAQYESFLASTQMALDSADPVNYTTATAANRDVLLFEVVGDGVSNLPDQVIPNNVLSVSGTVDAPLSGTDPLVRQMSLTQIDTSNTYAANTDTVVKFSGGHHGSVLTPYLADGTVNVDPTTTEYKAYAEMQTEMASFIASNGAVLSHTAEAADVIATVPAAP
ncbi:MAG: Ig-like domain-containing protein [Gammaproteobacteria bacterium]|nr:Ig-like domain-containing protein [Gammaproteobacteria bacterium]